MDTSYINLFCWLSKQGLCRRSWPFPSFCNVLGKTPIAVSTLFAKFACSSSRRLQWIIACAAIRLRLCEPVAAAEDITCGPISSHIVGGWTIAVWYHISNSPLNQKQLTQSSLLSYSGYRTWIEYCSCDAERLLRGGFSFRWIAIYRLVVKRTPHNHPCYTILNQSDLSAICWNN